MWVGLLAVDIIVCSEPLVVCDEISKLAGASTAVAGLQYLGLVRRSCEFVFGSLVLPSNALSLPSDFGEERKVQKELESEKRLVEFQASRADTVYSKTTDSQQRISHGRTRDTETRLKEQSVVFHNILPLTRWMLFWRDELEANPKQSKGNPSANLIGYPDVDIFYSPIVIFLHLILLGETQITVFRFLLDSSDRKRTAHRISSTTEECCGTLRKEPFERASLSSPNTRNQGRSFMASPSSVLSMFPNSS